MFHSFSAAEPFGEKKEKSIKKCYLHFISLLLFLFLDAFSNLGGWSLKRICGLMFWILCQPPSPVANLIFTHTYLRWDMTSFNTHLYPTVSAGVQTTVSSAGYVPNPCSGRTWWHWLWGLWTRSSTWALASPRNWMMSLLCGLAQP